MARSDQTSHAELYVEWHGGYMQVHDQRDSPGRRFYVSSLLGGTAGGDGDSPENPRSTIQGALGRCTTGDFDKIIVMPGHVETLTAAADITTAGVDGVHIIGIGNGEDRPRITFTEAAAVITIGSDNVTWENCIFITGIDQVVTMLNVTHGDCHLKNCEFREGAAIESLIYVTVAGAAPNAADGFWAEGNRFFGPVAGLTHGIAMTVVNDRIVIEDNFMCVDATTGPIWTDQVLTNILVKNNVVHSLSAGIEAIRFTAAATGQIVGNDLYGDTLNTTLDPGSCYCNENYEVDAIDQAAIPVPGLTAGPFLTNAFDAGAIAADTFTNAKIANNAIGATEIADAAFDADTYDPDVGVWRMAIKQYVQGVDGGGPGAIDIFTVTGPVLVRCIGTCAVDLAAGAAPTIELGTASDTNACIVQCADGRNLDQHEIWHDAAPAAAECDMITNWESVHTVCITAAENIILTIGANALTDGTIDFYCLWTPLADAANVVAA